MPAPSHVWTETWQQTKTLVVHGLQKAAYLADFAFKCERNPAGQTNYDWGYWFWILKVLNGCRHVVHACSVRLCVVIQAI